MKVKVWDKTDVMLKCDTCGREIVIPAGHERIVEDAYAFTSGGWRYIGCGNIVGERRIDYYTVETIHCDGVLEIYVKTKTGKWRLKSRSIFTEAIVSWEP